MTTDPHLAGPFMMMDGVLEWDITVRRIPLYGYRVRAVYTSLDRAFTVQVTGRRFRTEHAARQVMARYLTALTGRITSDVNPTPHRRPE